MQPATNHPHLIIGVGGAGGNIVEQMACQLTHADYLLVNTDADSLERRSSLQCLLIGRAVTSGHGAKRSMTLGQRAARSSMGALMRVCHGHERVILLAGLAGGTGAGSTLELAEELQRQGIWVGIVGVRPFDFEGESARMNTEMVLEKLSIMRIPNVVLALKDALEMMGTAGSLLDGVSRLDALVIQRAKELLQAGACHDGCSVQ